MNPQGSRLRRNTEKQTKKQIITYLVIIGVIFFIFISFGGAIIGGLGDIIFQIKGNKEQTNKITSKVHIEPPTIESLPEGTDKDSIEVHGTTSLQDGTAEIVVNDTSYKKIPIEDGKFEKNVRLSNGENIIKARVTKGNDTSDFSDETTVLYSKDAPSLEVSSPSNDQTFTKADQQINVTGKTDNGNTVVTVNDFRAIVEDDGQFSYYLRLNEGDNTIKVKATNTANKSTEKEIKVKYQP